jgi:DNA-binding Xre family transcriptional regulator
MKIKEVMKFRGVRVRDLEKSTGILKGNLSMIVNGRQKEITTTTLRKLCIALRCKSSDILGW